MIAAAAGVALSFVVVYLVAKKLVTSSNLAPMDVPDERRLHTRPTPRAGGIALPFVVAIGCGLLLATGAGTGALALAIFAFALPNGVLGAIDDYRPLLSRVKFGLQLLIAIAFVVFGPRVTEIGLPIVGAVHLGWFSYPFTAFFLVWCTNAFNFMDGLDALAAVSGMLAFAALGAIAVLFVPGGFAVAAICAFAFAGLAGFLLLNWPPARIFMGDGGALFIGALLGVVSVLLASSPPGAPAQAPFLATCAAWGPFLWDATYTLFFRILRGEDWLHPHRRHLFQRLAVSGWTHGQIRALYFGLAVFTAGVAVAMPALPGAAVAGLLGAAMAAFIWLAIATGRYERATGSG